MGVNSSYASTIPAVLKLIEAILDIIIIILVAATATYRDGPAGWILFVAILTFIVSFFFYIIHLTNVIYKLSGPMSFIEFVCITICGCFQLIAMIVASATTGGRPTIIATAVMCALSVIVYGIDAFFLFALYKVHGGYLNNPSVTQQATTHPPPVDTPKYGNAMYDNAGFAR
ncbi:unnamed protein product [Dicrocoelium dendriticum]|nr:unnamed protein product [Dicrocoelium dendriticum]